MNDASGDPRRLSHASLVFAEFLRKTAHLGPEGQRRVLETIVKANQHKRARLEAQAAIDKAMGDKSSR